ncbi:MULTISPECIES: hypothetical protein [Bacillus]|uniref:hypothetical protein n=1 Tax=Bacillus TaxID=1386 RepID=UPI001F5C2B43|nr:MULTISPECIES: hypothetical protein [Bacillus]MCI3195362.1 hypothetical protein [Bacillus sp. HU-1818]MCY8992493.1 hypothetical protein [Bacillus atrophaeus]
MAVIAHDMCQEVIVYPAVSLTEVHKQAGRLLKILWGAAPRITNACPSSRFIHR